MKGFSREAWRFLAYRAARNRNPFHLMPANVTLSVTNRCNSHCRTCFIWDLYRRRPQLSRTELGTQEFDAILRSLGRDVMYLTISGGEPFLRDDLPEICTSAYERCRPSVVTIPTNTLLPKLIERGLRRILSVCEEASFTINLSLDAVGAKHDEIRGVEGNFRSFMDTFTLLSAMKKEFSNLNVGIHSVLSIFNLNDILETYEFARKLRPDSYIVEVAEERTELFNQLSSVTPPVEMLRPIMKKIGESAKRDYMNSGGFLVRLIQASRLVYYDEIPYMLREKRQLRPCYAGFASCQITPYGDVWPCCTLGYDEPMGNMRETSYDFRKIWFSPRADEVRNRIRSGGCFCPLANAWYSSAFCDLRTVLRIGATLVASYEWPLG